MTVRRITRIEVAQLLELEEGFLVELEREAIVLPDPEGMYDPLAIERARLCCTLHRELGVNLPGVEIVIEVLERWRADRRRTAEILARLRDELRRNGDD